MITIPLPGPFRRADYFRAISGKVIEHETFLDEDGDETATDNS